jgi:Pyrimidine dimer DNA glycosylase
MRMWNVDVTKMCDQHLTGEHVELHMFVGSIRKGKNIAGFIRNGMVEVHNIRKRHNEIAKEMESRGMNHKSPLPLFRIYKAGHIDIEANEQVLADRCSKCSFRETSYYI